MLDPNALVQPYDGHMTGDHSGAVVLLGPQGVRMLLFGEVGNLYSWRNAQHGHRAVSGILREEWPPPETGGCGYPKEVAAPNRFSWPRSAEMKRWPRLKYAFASVKL